MKRINFSLYYFLVPFLLLAASTRAVAQITLGTEIRPRTELRNGFKTLHDEDDDPSFFTEQRSRLSLTYVERMLKASLVFQDIRIWGETGQINKNDGLTSVHEAWAELLLNNRFSIKAGRQELIYDDHRILGNLDWAAQARSHDALVFKFTDSTLAVHAGVAYNQDSKVPEPVKLTGNFYAPSGGFISFGGGLPNYKTMQYLWFQKILNKSQVTALVLNSGWQLPDTTINYFLTAGINPTISVSKNFKFIGSVFYQTGWDRSNKKLNSWMFSAAFQVSLLKGLPLTFGADVLSGTKPGSSISKTFDPLFGTHHAFYGHMDYFYVGNPHAQQGVTIGLEDFFIKTNFKTGKKTSLLIHLHEFRSQVPIIDPENQNENLTSRLGNEIDMIFNYDHGSNINVKIGYSQMAATRSMEAIKGGDRSKLQTWAWCMLTVKPSVALGGSLK